MNEVDPMVRVDAARAALKRAKREALAAWALYERQTPSNYDPRARRAQAATHLPEDMLELLGIDRYGGAR
jgi:hypothetical protein